jgi:CBS domain-containing protein
MELPEVARLMVEHDCGAIPVVETEDNLKPVGMITDRDITCRAVAKGVNPQAMKASDVMTPSPITVTPDAPVEECRRALEEHQIRRAIVVDDDGRCCGIVAQADIAKFAPERETAELVKEVSQSSEAPARV